MNVAIKDMNFVPKADLRALIADAIDTTIDKIAPAWPLASTVAVNPFAGHATIRLAEVAALHDRLAGVAIFMPADWYRGKIATGEIARKDLLSALAKSDYTAKPADISQLVEILAQSSTRTAKIPALAEIASQATGDDWPTIIEDCVGRWAASHFDTGASLWEGGSTKGSAWKSWQVWAKNDRTPEILGLTGFRNMVAELPDDPVAAIEKILEELNPSFAGLENQFYQTLLAINGWAQHARYLRWTAALNNGTDETIIDLLAMRLCWDYALYRVFRPGIEKAWENALAELAKPIQPSADNIAHEIAQEAYELGLQRGLADKLAAHRPTAKQADKRPEIQAAFCIDVRSEVYRRALESLSDDIETFGFAGFFGLPIEHTSGPSSLQENRLPVLLAPGLKTCSHEGKPQNEFASHLVGKTGRPWHQVRTAALTSFAYVEAIGPTYIWQLVKRTLGISSAKSVDTGAAKPVFETELDPVAKCDIAEKVLRAMSFTKGFAKTVILAGHGANVTNNPHKSALHCGACGGHAGDVNARLLADLLNDQAVRHDLVKRGIDIPDDTLFIAALHDTTTDTITLFERDLVRVLDTATLARLKDVIAQAGFLARSERKARLPGATHDRDIMARATNWAETRPEWGLAGCKYFIAAPRGYSAHAALNGESFLHNYDHHADAKNGYPVLELILTAPVVVASWISLQYYASTVAPDLYGSGNKLLHNVVGGIGVYEGNGGQLRTGLPIQSVHSGSDFVHHPARLTVCLDAPIEAINAVLEKHPSVRALFDNGWLHLLAFGPSGKLALRYAGDLRWEEIDAMPPTEKA